MTLLKSFSTLALISSAVLMLLPEGSLRKTAALVIGLLLMLCWAEGLLAMLPEAYRPFPAAMLLVPTDVSVDAAARDAAAALAERFVPEVTAGP